MIVIEYKIYDDTLVRNTYDKDNLDRLFLCKQERIITKEAFIKCYNEWIKNDEIDNSGGAE